MNDKSTNCTSVCFSIDERFFLIPTLIPNFLSIVRFKIKYHPEESVKRKEEQVGALKVPVTPFT